ncbi:MAG: hypothetical protein Q7R73_04845 [bacterium]|nr:hypothetical protein [bacterium]
MNEAFKYKKKPMKSIIGECVKVQEYGIALVVSPCSKDSKT